MDQSSLKQALDGAQFVKVSDLAGGSVIFVWHGGTTVNIYSSAEWEQAWECRECFSMSDGKGRPVDQEAIEGAMERHLAAIQDEVRNE